MSRRQSCWSTPFSFAASLLYPRNSLLLLLARWLLLLIPSFLQQVVLAALIASVLASEMLFQWDPQVWIRSG